jgi:DNA-directed RNA polymerase subunit RPC12/RpoP
MPNPTYFVQECPTCGRRLQIRVEYLGRKVVCQHCRGQLVACDPASNRYPELSQSDELLRRAEQLLHDAAENLQSRTYNHH